MSDPIQADLLAWVAGESARGEAAARALAAEWRPRVRRFLLNPAEDEVEEALQHAIVERCVWDRADPDARPAVLAPPGHDPRAWRARVLKNHLVDQARRRGRRRHFEQAVAAGLPGHVERGLWARAREQRAAREPVAPVELAPPPVERGDLGVEEVERTLELAARRRQVAAALTTLSLRRRVVLALALGLDPSPWAEEVARALKEPAADVLARIRLALASGAPQGARVLTEAQLRVLWPGGSPTDRDTARKTLARAVEDVTRRLGGP